MAWFESKDKKARKAAFKNVLAVMVADGKVTESEMRHLAKVAIRLELSEKDVREILDDPASVAFVLPDDVRERAAQLIDIILMMMVDGDIQEREMALCVAFAIRLGFPPSAVKKVVESVLDSLRGGQAAGKISSDIATYL